MKAKIKKEDAVIHAIYEVQIAAGGLSSNLRDRNTSDLNLPILLANVIEERAESAIEILEDTGAIQ